MRVPKTQPRPSELPAQKKNLKSRTIRKAARISPVKNARMVTIAGAIVSTVLADAVLQQLP